MYFGKERLRGVFVDVKRVDRIVLVVACTMAGIAIVRTKKVGPF